MAKLTKEKLFDMMLADTRIASWVRTEYRNMLGTAYEPAPKEPEAIPAEEAD